MSGNETLYSSKETISSPVKSLLLQHQKEEDARSLEDANDGDNSEASLSWDHLHKIFDQGSEKVKHLFGETITSLKEKYQEAKSKFISHQHSEQSIETGENGSKKTKLLLVKKKKQPKQKSKSRIFVTRSSKEFAQIQIQEQLSNLRSCSQYITPSLGPCIVALPYALKQSGLILGVLLMFFVLISMDYAECLMHQCVSSALDKQNNIAALSKQLFGRIGYFLYFGAPYLLHFCLLLAYLIILGDVSTKSINAFVLMLDWEFTIRRNLALFIVFLLVLPTSLIKNNKLITKISSLTIIPGTILMTLIVLRYFTLGEQIPHVSEIYHPFKYLGSNVIQSVTVITFTFICQHNIRSTYMQSCLNKEYDVNNPVDIVASFMTVINLLIAGVGYTTFNVFTQGNILENYCGEDILAGLTRTVFLIFIILLFPVECFHIRLMTDELILVHHRFKNIFHFISTFIILLPIFLASLFMDCVPLVLEMSGVLIAIPLVFILPAAIFLRRFPGNVLASNKLPCFSFMCLGITLSVIGLAVTMSSSHNCIHSSNLLPYCNGSSELVGPLITFMSLNTSLSDNDFSAMNTNVNVSRLEQYGFENLTDVVNAYLA